MSFVRVLQLTNFRCYGAARLEGLCAGPVILYGPNGAGKTNILEAVSFLSPGRGLRGARIQDVQRRSEGGGQEAAWSVAACVETSYGEIRIGTGRDPAKEQRRAIRINGESARGQGALGEYLSCVWLTPQMDRLFLDAASERRRFLDRLVFSFDPGHAGRVTRYENAMRQRAKLLQQDHFPDSVWLEGLEETMAQTGVAIAAARVDFVSRLQRACDGVRDSDPKKAGNHEDFPNIFPRALLRVTGTVEELLVRVPALEVEEMFKYQLAQTREKDALTGGAATGPHKADLSVAYPAKNMPADQCSTGEQKALLIGIVLAHARLIAAERGAPPILLLDEVAAHLDDGRRAALHDILLALGGQVWLTGTDSGLFRDLRGKASFFAIENSTLRHVSEACAA